MRLKDHTVGVGVITLIGLGIAAFISVMTGTGSLFSDPIEVTVLLEDAAGAAEGAAVKVAGVTVGSVSDLSLDSGRARLTLQIDPSAGVTTDMFVQVRARSLLGEKYIALIPSPQPDSPLADGGQLTNTRPSLDVDDLLNRLGPLLDGVDGEALAGIVTTLSDALEEDPERLRRMLVDAETILDNAATASTDLPALAEQTGSTLASVRRAADAGDRTLSELSSAAARADDIAAKAETLADNADALVTETRAAIEKGDDFLTVMISRTDDIEQIIDNLKEIDRWELRRLLREEGILLRLKPDEVTPE